MNIHLIWGSCGCSWKGSSHTGEVGAEGWRTNPPVNSPELQELGSFRTGASQHSPNSKLKHALTGARGAKDTSTNGDPPQLLHPSVAMGAPPTELSTWPQCHQLNPRLDNKPFSKRLRQRNYVPVKHQILDSEQGFVPSAALTSLWDYLAKEVRRIPNSGLVGWWN